MAILTQTHNGLKFVGTGTSILNDNGQQIMRLIGTTRTNTKVGIGPHTPTTVFTVHDIQDTSYFSGIGIHQYEETYDGQQPHHFFNAVGGTLNLVADSVKDINIMQGQNGNHVAIFKHVGSSAYRMGLGTEDPDAKLHVYGGTANTEIFLGEDAAADKAGIIKYNQGDGNGIGTLQLGHWGDTLGTAGMTIKKGGSVGIGTDDPEEELHVVGTAKVTGDLLLGETGTTPKIDMMFEDISTGPGYDRRIHIGKSDDLPNSNSYPTYTGAGAYGVQFQSHSDGAFFGIVPYSTNNYRPVINWGDDTTDSPFAFQFNGTDVFKVTTSGKVAGTGHSWDAFRPMGLSGTEGVGSETNKLVLSGGSINFKGSGGSGSTNLQIDGTTFLSSGLALTINSGTLGGNEIATLVDTYRTKANIGSHGTGRWRNSSNLYPEPAAELINAATGNPFNSGIISDTLMYKEIESYSYDGSAWADCSSETDFNELVVPNSAHTWSGVSLERDQDDYIMYISNQTGYGFHGWLLIMHSTDGNSFSYKIETTDTNPDTLAKKTEDVGGSTGWSVVDANLGDNISSWPGYTIDKIYLRTGSTSDDYVRIRITPNWNANSTTKIHLGKIGMYATYGSFLKPASVDKDRFFKFNNGIGIGDLYGSANHYINAHKNLTDGMFSTYRNDTGFVLNRAYADYGNDGTTIEYQERIGVDGNSASVGTFGAHKFSLRTSNTDALVVDTDGKIGINTASNSAEETNNGVPRLQVTTATAALGEFPLAARFTTASDAGNNSGVSVLINSGNDRGLMISAGREVENVAKVTLNVVENNGNELDTITMKQSSAGSSSAFVGIGTTSPGQKLEVNGNILATVANNGNIKAQYDTNNLAQIQANSSGGVFTANASGTTNILLRSYGDSYFTGGNVGIGATSPQKKLHVSSGDQSTARIRLSNTNTASGGDNIELVAGVHNVTQDGFSIYNASGGGTQFVIQGGGNVGIGNTSPKEKLDVQGSVVLGREHGISQLHNNLGFNKLAPGLVWREYDYTESPAAHVTSSEDFNRKIKDHTTFTESGIATIVNGFTRSDDTYIVEFVGYYFAEEAGTHLFSVSADDSTDMFIDGKRVAFWYGGHGDNSAATGGTTGSGGGTTQTPGSIYLEKGYHRIYTRFHEVTGGDSINLWHQAPSDTAYEVIPAANLFHEAADRAMSTEDGVEFHEAVVSAKELTAFDGVLNLDDNGDADGVINAKASLTINIDADNNATGEAFRINKNTTAVDSTPLLQISESMVTRFNAQQNSGSRIELYNNRQDQSNVEVFRIASYNSVEASGIHFYRGGGGASGYATVYAKKNNASNLERVVKFGGDDTLDATFAADVIAYSDERVKENIKTLDGKKVFEMRGVSYNRTDQDGRFSSGVIAQELEKVAPELVKDDGDLKAVAYGNLTGYLIEAIKELKQEVEELKKQINNG